jgi:biopolymer transport protein ExbB/TolQ
MNKLAKNGPLTFIIGGIFVGILVIAASHLLGFVFPPLAKGGSMAVLLFDWSTPPLLPIPYPFTIQNLTTLVLFAALGELWWHRLATKKAQTFVHMKLLPEDDRTVLGPVELASIRLRVLEVSEGQDAFLPSAIDQVIMHFQVNRTTNEAHELLNSMVDLEMHRVDLSYATLRYVTWLLPSLGLLGTIVGIALALEAMAKAQAPVSMNDVIKSLATSFNTTIVGLAWSMIVIFGMTKAQREEEAAVNKGASYCLKNLINRLFVPPT